MRKFWLVAGMMLWLSQVNAQQKPHYTQYLLNQYIINPALTGIENYSDIRISHRHQWTGITDAPVTSYITAHTAIGKQDYRTTATSFSIEGENPRGRAYWEDYTAAEPHHGVGIQVINDETGPISNFSAYLTYAYHLGISARTSLSGGFGVGMNRINLNASKLQFYNSSVDPAVYSSNNIRRVKPDLMAGLYLYSANYFVGVSAQQILPQRIDFSNNQVKVDDSRLIPHLFATAGYRFLAGENFNITPSVLVKYINHTPTQVDINTKVQFRDFAWVGVGYRVEEGFNGMLGINVAKKVSLSYAYDYTSSGLNNYTTGTHEVVIGFMLGNGYSDSCPRNVW